MLRQGKLNVTYVGRRQATKPDPSTSVNKTVNATQLKKPVMKRKLKKVVAAPLDKAPEDEDRVAAVEKIIKLTYVANSCDEGEEVIRFFCSIVRV